MNIFITGATGYVGNNLANRLAAEGHTVHAICRSANKKSLLSHPNIKIFEGDINNVASIENGMKNCEQVYHLAAFARVWSKDPGMFYKLNVEGTKNVLDVAKKLDVKNIVFTSTGGVLGPSNGRPVKEDDQRYGNVFNEYEDTKTQAENLCKEYCNKYGLRIVIVNPPRIYGPGIESESNAVTRLVKLYVKGKWKILPGDGKRTGSYVHATAARLTMYPREPMISNCFLPMRSMRYKPTNVKIKLVPPMAIELNNDSFAPRPALARISGA